jgi:hypothetical protein
MKLGINGAAVECYAADGVSRCDARTGSAVRERKQQGEAERQSVNSPIRCRRVWPRHGFLLERSGRHVDGLRYTETRVRPWASDAACEIGFGEETAAARNEGRSGMSAG